MGWPLGPPETVFTDFDFGGTKVSCFLARDVNPASSFGGVDCSAIGYCAWAIDVFNYFVHVTTLLFTLTPSIIISNYFHLFISETISCNHHPIGYPPGVRFNAFNSIP
jgi:hypothetical protein